MGPGESQPTRPLVFEKKQTNSKTRSTLQPSLASLLVSSAHESHDDLVLYFYNHPQSVVLSYSGGRNEKYRRQIRRSVNKGNQSD